MVEPQPTPTIEAPASWYDSRQAHWAMGVIIVIALYLLSQHSFPLFHTLVELVTIAIGWAAFLLLWNGRMYQLRESFVVVGLGLLVSGAMDLLHTLSFKGVGLFTNFEPINLSTQFWIGARGIETLGWLLFALLLRRKNIVRASAITFVSLGAVLTLSILTWRNFPVCFDPETGVTAFKMGMEISLVALLVAAFYIMRSKADELDPKVSTLLQRAILVSAFAELAFITYNDALGIGNLLGHYARIISRYLIYRALIHMAVVKPYSLFFHKLQTEKDKVTESQNRWKTLALNNPDFIMELDENLVVRFANYPAPGMTMDQIIGLNILDLVPESEKERVRGHLSKALTTQERVRYETCFPDPQGKTLYFESTAAYRPSANGQKAGITLVARDITTAHTREQLARARWRISEFAIDQGIPELLQKVLDEAEILTQSQLGFFHFVHEDQEGLVLQARSTRTVSEACKTGDLNTYCPLSQAGVWADCVRKKAPIIHNDFARQRFPKGFPADHAPIVRGMVVPLLKQDRVVAVIGVGNKPSDYGPEDIILLNELADQAWDIVVRKKAELEAVETEKRLVEALSNLPGMVFRCANDDQWTMAFVSDGCKDLTGFDPHELIDNQSTSYAALIHPEDRENVWDQVQESLEKNTPYQIVYRILPRGQATKWVWEQGRGQYANNELQCIEGFIYDISAQVQAQQDRQDMEKKVLESQKLESLGVLAGGIAHDFNNLLQAMLGFAELASHQMETTHPAQESIDRVIESARRAADLTGQMLAFSGRGHFTKTRVNLSEQVDEMASLLESSVTRSVEFHRNLSPALPRVAVDTAQFQQVVLNLITNAAEAIGEKAGSIHLQTGEMFCSEAEVAENLVQYEAGAPRPTPGNYVFVEVSDTGCGMDSETQARVFEPFFTTKFTGRGLGMAAVQGIIRGHGGILSIHSVPDQGTSISVFFPVSKEPADHDHDLSANPSIPGYPVQAQKILVVDDEQEVLEIVCSGLEHLGYQCVCARNGQEAVEIFRLRPQDYSLVLLDLVMPIMGGKESLQHMREIHPNIPIVLMSGFAELEIRQRFKGTEIAGILAKPFFQRQLAEVLEAALAQTE